MLNLTTLASYTGRRYRESYPRILPIIEKWLSSYTLRLVLHGRDAEAAAHQGRDQLGDQGGLAAAAPAGQADDFHGPITLIER